MGKENPWHMLAMFSTLGTEVILLTLGGGWLGSWLDGVWETKPLLLVLGVFLGLALGFFSAYYTLKKIVKEDSP